ncbi:hypothetical protein FA15DRAFT_699832 [Coprinopsis marcescibilis]|uniref:Uncharacterized protein n=1 Tax=Coprinopsis marcescibilis TaxID=230819 RepID=A0A5C3LNJ9_COPMA|nr:hypothetical protein FA15DRAFT_699832 [Coprinopsis marcescibilis]
MDGTPPVDPSIILDGRIRRPRDKETLGQRLKREKAAERQRRKRERDRVQAQAEAASQAQTVANIAMMAFASPESLQHHFAQLTHQVVAAAVAASAGEEEAMHTPPGIPQPLSPTVDMQDFTQPLPIQHLQQVQHQIQQTQPDHAPHTPSDTDQGPVTPEEAERREKVRAAARERQRKHRLQVKQKKMRELGLDVDVVNPIEDFRPPDFPHDFQQPLGGMLGGDFASANALGGQTFASTLLLSFSCAPLLKAHLLRTLNMTNEELASLEPIIAEAWDKWNAQRQARYAEAVKNGQTPQGMHSGFPIDLTQPPPPPHHDGREVPHPPPNNPHTMPPHNGSHAMSAPHPVHNPNGLPPHPNHGDPSTLPPHALLQHLHLAPPFHIPGGPLLHHIPPPPGQFPPHLLHQLASSPFQHGQITPQQLHLAIQALTQAAGLQQPPPSPPHSPTPPSQPQPQSQRSLSPQLQPQSPVQPAQQAQTDLAPPQPTQPSTAHPPPPTFACSEGPSILAPPPPPPPTTTTTEVKPTLDFRNRFSLHGVAAAAGGVAGPLPSTYRSPYGDDPHTGMQVPVGGASPAAPGICDMNIDPTLQDSA